ncbi:MAG: 50S ribosomal protein L2 [Candidatus Wildermuthbacteria bacterium]|nr:50S ribosomal protein L2 [Candidatus Wildermuthbacteria bacterium]
MANAFSNIKPQKSLVMHIRKTGGRSRDGRITAWQRGGGARKIYRLVEFGQSHFGKKGKVLQLEKDPNRNCFIALVEYLDGVKAYILAPQELQAGDEVVCAESAEIRPGNRMLLVNMPVGTMAHNIELHPGKGGVMARSAGGGAKVLAHEGGYTLLQLPSSEIRKAPSACFASVGMLSNPEYQYKRVHNAGRSRLMGRRPNVRGTVMNPVDHPHGGGEGRTGRGLKNPKTPWGKPALGVKTRHKKWTDKLIVNRRKKKNKNK